MTRSPTFSPATETTTPPRTVGPAAPRPSPLGQTSPASPWRHDRAYRRASLSPARFPSIRTCQVDGAGTRPGAIEECSIGFAALQHLGRTKFDRQADSRYSKFSGRPIRGDSESRSGADRRTEAEPQLLSHCLAGDGPRRVAPS